MTSNKVGPWNNGDIQAWYHVWYVAFKVYASREIIVIGITVMIVIGITVMIVSGITVMIGIDITVMIVIGITCWHSDVHEYDHIDGPKAVAYMSSKILMDTVNSKLTPSNTTRWLRSWIL